MRFKRLLSKIMFYRGISRRNKTATAVFLIIFGMFASLYIYNAFHPQGSEAAWAPPQRGSAPEGLIPTGILFALVVSAKKKYYVYLLKSLKDNNYYIGQTDSVEKRFLQHNNGYSKSTKPRRPFVLIGFETYGTQRESRWIEYQYKNHSDKKLAFIERLLKKKNDS